MTITENRYVDDQPRGRKRRPRARTGIVVALLIVLPLAALTMGLLWFMWQLDPPGKAGDEIEVRIQDGWSVSRIGDELADRDVIGSPFVFSAYSRLKGQTDFQAGTYDLRRDMGVRDAVSALEDGPRIDYVEVVIPPGTTAAEAAEIIGDIPGHDADLFMRATLNGSARSKYQPAGAGPNLEGLIWPDTYRVSDTDDEIAILAQMVDLFDERADALGLETASVEGRGAYELIVIASLIEAEAKFDEDRPLIASVIYNRLRDEMPLQIDATLIYGTGGTTEADQQAPGPYNTYLNQGLPPTPIGSVSEASLRAAMNPADTDYFYYVAGPDGRHLFAEDFDEHRDNIEAVQAAGG